MLLKSVHPLLKMLLINIVRNGSTTHAFHVLKDLSSPRIISASLLILFVKLMTVMMEIVQVVTLATVLMQELVFPQVQKIWIPTVNNF